MKPGIKSERFEVVIVGSGFAGLAAAQEAAAAGAKVLVLEKRKTPGGNSVLAEGAFAAAGSGLQARQGIRDSPELMARDMLKAGLGLNHPRLAIRVAEDSAAILEWTRSALGVCYQDTLNRVGGHSVARTLTTKNTTGVDIVRPLVKRCLGLGVEIRYRARVIDLITEAETHRPEVLIARPDGGSVRIKADRGIILASGGYGADIAFRSNQDPRLGAAVETTNHPGATAEVLKAALRLGAAPVHLSHIQLGPWACADEKGYGPACLLASRSFFAAGILLDPRTGERIVNEMADRKVRSDALLAVGHPCIAITDRTGAGRAPKNLAHCLKRGKVIKSDSLEDLFRHYGLPISAASVSVERYNAAVKGQRADDWGKPMIPEIGPIEQPPFYGLRLWPKIHHTSGGLLIDERTRVLDLNGSPIPGLFAAGEVSGGTHGACRLGSTAIPECLIFGRLAGRGVLST